MGAAPGLVLHTGASRSLGRGISLEFAPFRFVCHVTSTNPILERILLPHSLVCESQIVEKAHWTLREVRGHRVWSGGKHLVPVGVREAIPRGLPAGTLGGLPSGLTMLSHS